jgi:type VI secretion system secreted protein Hcp
MAIAAMYLRIKGITGESLVSGHSGEIDVVAWDWGMEAGSPLSDGSPGAAASMRTINVVKLVDRATPALFQYLDQHKVVSDARLTVNKAGGGAPLAYLTVDMTKVRIVRVDVSSYGPELTERVTLSCETVTLNYTPQSSLGTQASGAISFTAIHPAAGP